MLHGQAPISTICEASFLWIGIQTTQSKMAYNARYNVEVAIERNKLCAMLLQNKFKSNLSLWTKDGKQEERHRKKTEKKTKNGMLETFKSVSDKWTWKTMKSIKDGIV